MLGYSSAAFAAIFKHFGWHGVVELPDHFDRPFALVAHVGGLTEIREGKREAVLFFLLARENENPVSALGVMDEILTGVAGQ